MKKKTQIEFVFNELLRKGKISRNQCLKRYISRLAAYVSDIKAMGYKIEGKKVKTKTGQDYVYTLIDKYSQ